MSGCAHALDARPLDLPRPERRACAARHFSRPGGARIGPKRTTARRKSGPSFARKCGAALAAQPPSGKPGRLRTTRIGAPAFRPDRTYVRSQNDEPNVRIEAAAPPVPGRARLPAE